MKLIASKEQAPFYEDYSIEASFEKNPGTSQGSSTGTKKWAPAAWQVKDSPGPQTAALVHPYRFSRGPFAICTCLRVASIIGKKIFPIRKISAMYLISQEQDRTASSIFHYNTIRGTKINKKGR